MLENVNQDGPLCWNDPETENPHEVAEAVRNAARRWIALTLEATARNEQEEREAPTLARQVEEIAYVYDIGVEKIIDWIPQARKEGRQITQPGTKMWAQRYAAVRRVDLTQRIHAMQCNAREYRR